MERAVRALKTMQTSAPSALAVSERPGASQAASWRVWLALGTVYLFWGSTYLGIRVVVESVPALSAGAARFLVAGAVMLVFALLRGGLRPMPSGREVAAAVGAGVLLIGGGNGGVMLAEQGMASGPTALLISVTPLFIALLAFAFLGQRPGARVWAGLLLGLAGLAVLVGIAGSTPVTPRGAAITLGAAAFWAAGSVWSSRARLPASPAASSGLQMLGGAAVLALGALGRGEPWHLRLQEVGWRPAAALLYLVVFGSLVGFSAYAWLLRRAPLSLVATYAYVNPVVAVILGAALLGEPLTGRELIGGAVVLAGVALIAGQSRRGARTGR
ncbi:MAG: EamA family transporter [Candidatus Dormibacterales bacterium]